MTLKEKILPKMYCFMGSGMLSNTYDKDIAEVNASECEKIADEYAVEFVKWLIDKKSLNFAVYVNSSFEELLEMFKKEKGW